MNRRITLAVVIVGILGAGSACRAVAPPSPGAPLHATSSAPVTVMVTESDSGKTVALPIGGRLEVFLRSTPDNPWSAIAVDGAALRSVTDGKLALALGVTGAAYVGQARGEARATSSRRLCPSPAADTAACTALQSFTLTVEVR